MVCGAGVRYGDVVVYGMALWRVRWWWVLWCVVECCGAVGVWWCMLCVVLCVVVVWGVVVSWCAVWWCAV